MNHTCLCLPSRNWSLFTDPGGMEGWVGLKWLVGWGYKIAPLPINWKGKSCSCSQLRIVRFCWNLVRRCTLSPNGPSNWKWLSRYNSAAVVRIFRKFLRWRTMCLVIKVENDQQNGRPQVVIRHNLPLFYNFYILFQRLPFLFRPYLLN